jgi:hypothetical protein
MRKKSKRKRVQTMKAKTKESNQTLQMELIMNTITGDRPYKRLL